MSSPTPPQLLALTERFPEKHIGVFGDFALDCYWNVDVLSSLPSVETGMPTLPVTEQRYAPGAAGNVTANLCALGCGRVTAFGLVGPDPWGHEMLRVLDALGVDSSGLVEQKQNWATLAYVKPHIDDVEQRRIDFGDFNRISTDSVDRLISNLAEAIPSLDAIVINAQARSGIHSDYLRSRLAALVESNPDRVFLVDSRDPQTMYDGCVLKINAGEAARYCKIAVPGVETITREQSLAAAEALFIQRGKPVFVTRGKHGILVHDSSGASEFAAIGGVGEADTVGAGDSVLSGVSAALACGAVPAMAACFGNLAAAVSTRKLRQTGTASPEEIASLLEQQL